MKKRTVRRDAPVRAVVRPHLLVAIVGLVVVICACDSRRKGAFALDTCEQYAHQVRSCLGERAATRASAWLTKPIKSDAERQKLESLCSSQSAQLRLVCR